MLSGSENHYDRGDGTCGYCFEEWPCRGSEGAVWSGIFEWEQEEWRNRYDRDRAKKDRQIEYINETFCRLGLGIEFVRQASGMSLTLEEFLAIARKFNEMVDSPLPDPVD
jgi:hypothetical protein